MFRRKRKTPKYKFAYGKGPAHRPARKKRRRVSTKAKSASRSPIQKPRRRPSKFRALTKLSLLGALILLSLYALFFSNFFLITDVITDTNQENEALNSNIKKLLSESVGQNIFLADMAELETIILENIPEIEQVNVSRVLPNGINISYMSRPLAANIISESPTLKRSFIINEIGYIVKEDLENKSLPYIKVISEEPINSQTPVLSQAHLNFILDAQQEFEERFGMRVVEVEYKKIAREAHLLTEKDFKIWLDIQQSYDEKFKALKKAIIKLDIYNEPLEYIDLRLGGKSGNKIIYRRRT